MRIIFVVIAFLFSITTFADVTAYSENSIKQDGASDGLSECPYCRADQEQGTGFIRAPRSLDAQRAQLLGNGKTESFINIDSAVTN